MLPERGLCLGSAGSDARGHKLQGRACTNSCRIIAFASPTILAFRLLTLLFCSLHPNNWCSRPNQPKSPCDTLNSLTKSALVASFNPASHHFVQHPKLCSRYPLLLGFHAYEVELPHSTVILCLRTRMQMDAGPDIKPNAAPNKPPPLNSDQLNYLVWRFVFTMRPLHREVAKTLTDS